MRKTDNDIETSERARKHGLRRISRKHIALDESSLKDAKVRVTIYIDADILAYFKNRAAKPNSARYQTQINNELRAVMERSHNDEPYTELINDERFIESVALKVKQAKVAQTLSNKSLSNAGVFQDIQLSVFQSQKNAERTRVDLWTGANSNTSASRTTRANTKPATAKAA